MAPGEKLTVVRGEIGGGVLGVDGAAEDGARDVDVRDGGSSSPPEQPASSHVAARAATVRATRRRVTAGPGRPARG